MSASVVSVEYRSVPDIPPEAYFRDERILLGLYHVEYDDGWQVALPHTGWLGTVSEEPLDVDEPEHRAVIVEWADGTREDV